MQNCTYRIAPFSSEKLYFLYLVSSVTSAVNNIDIIEDIEKHNNLLEMYLMAVKENIVTFPLQPRIYLKKKKGVGSNVLNKIWC